MKTKKTMMLLLALTALLFFSCKQPNSNNGGGDNGGGGNGGGGTPTNSITLHAIDNILAPAGITTIEVTGNVTPLFVMTSDENIVNVELLPDGKTIKATAGSTEGVATITAYTDDVTSNPLEITVSREPDYQLEFIDKTVTVKEKGLDEGFLNLRIGADITGTITAKFDKAGVAEATIDQGSKKVTVKGLTEETVTLTLTDGTNNSTNAATITVKKADTSLTLEQLNNPIGIGNTRVLNINRGADIKTGTITVTSSDNSVTAVIKDETVVVTGVKENMARDAATITITHTDTQVQATARVTVDEAYTFVFKAQKPSGGTINDDGTVVTGNMTYIALTLTHGAKIIQGSSPNYFTMQGDTSFTSSISWDSKGANVQINTAKKGVYKIHAIDSQGIESNEITFIITD